jgi:hypothetical protein
MTWRPRAKNVLPARKYLFSPTNSILQKYARGDPLPKAPRFRCLVLVSAGFGRRTGAGGKKIENPRNIRMVVQSPQERPPVSIWTYEEEDTCCIYGHMRRRIHAVSMDI